MGSIMLHRKHIMARLPLWVGAMVAWLSAACTTDDDFVAPSFLHVDGIDLVMPSQNAVTTDTGFYTADIRSVFVTLLRAGSNHPDTVGLFELPFTTPILYDGEVEYIELSPAVWQSGMANAQIYYTYYRRIRLEGLSLTSGDTLDLGRQRTTYNITRSDVLLFEPFEPTQASIIFDSTMLWERHAVDEACCGEGYGYVHLPDSLNTLHFYIDHDFYVTDPGKLVYLELDYRSDLQFKIMMEASEHSGGNTTMYGVMDVYPKEQWTHLYVNIGRARAYINNPNDKFRLHFYALGGDGATGDVRLDNVRLLTTSNVL